MGVFERQVHLREEHRVARLSRCPGPADTVPEHPGRCDRIEAVVAVQHERSPEVDPELVTTSDSKHQSAPNQHG